MGGLRDQAVETGRFKVEMGGLRDQGVETGRFKGGDGWVEGSGGGDG